MIRVFSADGLEGVKRLLNRSQEFSFQSSRSGERSRA